MYFDVEETGKRVKRLRKEKGLTQEQLAEKINISRIHLAHIEIGNKAPGIDLLIVLSEFFDTSLDYLILGKDAT